VTESQMVNVSQLCRASGASYLSVRDYAKALGVSERTVRRALDRGEIPHKRIGRLIRIPRASIVS
jgi:excisionase family DNA binding protein